MKETDLNIRNSK